MLVKTFWTGQIWPNISSIKKDYLVTSTKMTANYITKRTGYGEFNAQGAHLWLEGYEISRNNSFLPYILCRLFGTVKANKIVSLTMQSSAKIIEWSEGADCPAVFLNFEFLKISIQM